MLTICSLPVRQRNAALRMLGLPALPRKLPSRNWLIFWTLSTTISAAIIYDRREKRRATAKWARAVSHLAAEPLPAGPSSMPRKITVYLEAPPGDGLRVAQDHFAEYIKPVLAGSGIDWDFVVGRRQGDVRAAVAERVRRTRRDVEKDLLGRDVGDEAQLPTEQDAIEAIRKRNGIAEYDGVRGDVVVGRHTWKEYVRGLHEGWLGPLAPPPEPEPLPAPETPEGEKPEEAEAKPKTPPQPRPHNKPEQYPSEPLPMFIPAELGPATPVRFPHILGFLNTPTRMRRFFGRRYLADEIGREVAAVCFCTYREFRETPGDSHEYEQEGALAREEKDWLKSVWKEEKPEPAKEGEVQKVEEPKERIWASPMVLDPRIAGRMRRFEITPEDEERARRVVVPEEEIEGWTKGSIRSLWRWGARKWKGDAWQPNVGNLDDE
ncbi:uncharacterized protein E0L32_002831 [Thyridium curvatum]|uniref:Mitochondrial import inner membrane translocase subunit TIM54 n=1 Tax=Thyridium curvatum TaxID=1093900 RepID=A0A507BLY2_9PEZI|nr:uncharacterized protein E0L32_002831 [Thyridium curvatum]TPX17730.1 hypothetical protein E0L32_002831 [Thyridium curvatum]